MTIQKATAVLEQGDLHLARQILEVFLTENFDDPNGLRLLANIDLRENKLEDAEQKIRQAIRQEPDNISYQISLAEIFYQQQEFDQLIACCEAILQQNSQIAVAYNLLGLMALTKTDYDDALEKFSIAMKLEMPNVHAIKNYALTLHRIGQNKFAEKYSSLVIKLRPDNLEAKFTLGMSLRCQGKLEEAKDVFHAIREMPKARFNYGHIQLMQNNLKEGLENYQVWKTIIKPDQNLTLPEWDGTVNLGKTLLIVSHQGLGDTLFMSRFFPLIKTLFKKIIIQPGKPLIRLIKSMDAEFEVIESLQDQKYDYWCDVMELPYKLGLDNIDQIPLEPWFQMASKIPESDQIKVGINWAGNPLFHYDRVRSTSLDTFASLFEIPGVRWYSLHKGCREHEAEKYPLQTPLADAEDFYDTARVMQGLDLIISTETAIPNLAGALDIPTCLLTSQDVDWRWDAWYRSVEIYQQKNERDWAEPVSRVRTTLQEIVNVGIARYSKGNSTDF